MTVTAFYVKFPAQWWNPARIDLMLLAAGVLFVLAGPGRLALDELWLERRAESRRPGPPPGSRPPA